MAGIIAGPGRKRGKCFRAATQGSRRCLETRPLSEVRCRTMNPKAEPMQATDGKLEELILFVVRASEKDEHCCAAKLDKILFYTDFRAYDELGRSITGRRYRKLEGGPVPE